MGGWQTGRQRGEEGSERLTVDGRTRLAKKARNNQKHARPTVTRTKTKFLSYVGEGLYN